MPVLTLLSRYTLLFYYKYVTFIQLKLFVMCLQLKTVQQCIELMCHKKLSSWSLNRTNFSLSKFNLIVITITLLRYNQDYNSCTPLNALPKSLSKFSPLLPLHMQQRRKMIAKIIINLIGKSINPFCCLSNHIQWPTLTDVIMWRSKIITAVMIKYHAKHRI